MEGWHSLEHGQGEGEGEDGAREGVAGLRSGMGSGFASLGALGITGTDRRRGLGQGILDGGQGVVGTAAKPQDLRQPSLCELVALTHTQCWGHDYSLRNG